MHKDDFKNASFDCKEGWGPREPWEDIHSQIDGPAAHNVLKNFLERCACLPARPFWPGTQECTRLTKPPTQAM